MPVLLIAVSILQLQWLSHRCCVSHHLSGLIIHVYILVFGYVPAMHLLSWHMSIHPYLLSICMISVARLCVGSQGICCKMTCVFLLLGLCDLIGLSVYLGYILSYLYLYLKGSGQYMIYQSLCGTCGTQSGLVIYRSICATHIVHIFQ